MSQDPVRRLFEMDRFARHTGLELVRIGSGEATARLRLESHHLNGLDIAQGGAVFTLADFAFAAAANSREAVAVAANASITFIKAARGGTLTAEAREISRNPKLGSYTVEVRDETGDLVALFQGLAYVKSRSVSAAVSPGG